MARISRINKILSSCIFWASASGFLFCFFCFYFPQLPTLFPPGKGPFASLARVSNFLHFYFRLIDMSLFKYRGVAMGKPHCNSSIWTFRFCTYGWVQPKLILLFLFFSVKFREIPCHSVAMFLLGLPSVANASALLPIRRWRIRLWKHPQPSKRKLIF
jgi:hypothetical protein